MTDKGALLFLSTPSFPSPRSQPLPQPYLEQPPRETRLDESTDTFLPPELTPAEEAAARAKEQAEQDALPYKWSQTIADRDITFSVPGNLKGRDLVVDIKKQSISAGIKGQDPILKVRPSSPTRPPFQSTAQTQLTPLPHHAGHLPPSNPHRRQHLDALDSAQQHQGRRDPPGQGQQDGVVAARGDGRAQD